MSKPKKDKGKDAESTFLEAFDAYLNAPYEPPRPYMILVSPKHSQHKAYLKALGFKQNPCPLKGCYK